MNDNCNCDIEYLMMNFILSVIGGTVKIALLSGACIGAYAAYTKPSRASFDDYIGTKTNSTTGSYILSQISKLASKKALPIIYKDYVFFSIVEITMDQNTSYFVGAFNNWFE